MRDICDVIDRMLEVIPGDKSTPCELRHGECTPELAVQRYLRDGKTVEDLGRELAIKAYRHPSLPLIGFKYNMLESPKAHDVVRDCRGIVLEEHTWDVVAKPFRRFFNAGEDNRAFARFNWDGFTATTKEDGSLILLYHYRDRWHVNTSGSFGLGECGDSGQTWRQLFWSTSGIDVRNLDPSSTYIFEMWTPHNKVIRSYPGPFTSLLSMFHAPTLVEATVAEADAAAIRLGVPRPDHHRFNSMDEVLAHVRRMEASDKTWEGLVIRDDSDERHKVKSGTYVALHHLLENGNIARPDRLVPLVLAGDTDEVLAYLPRVGPDLAAVRSRLEAAFGRLLGVWRESWRIEVQKDFALAIAGRTPFTGLLFGLRRALGPDQTEQALRDRWRESGDLILRALYKEAV